MPVLIPDNPVVQQLHQEGYVLLQEMFERFNVSGKQKTDIYLELKEADDIPRKYVTTRGEEVSSLKPGQGWIALKLEDIRAFWPRADIDEIRKDVLAPTPSPVVSLTPIVKPGGPSKKPLSVTLKDVEEDPSKFADIAAWLVEKEGVRASKPRKKEPKPKKKEKISAKVPSVSVRAARERQVREALRIRLRKLLLSMSLSEFHTRYWPNSAGLPDLRRFNNGHNLNMSFVQIMRRALDEAEADVTASTPTQDAPAMVTTPAPAPSQPAPLMLPEASPTGMALTHSEENGFRLQDFEGGRIMIHGIEVRDLYLREGMVLRVVGQSLEVSSE